jgi:hypothetical protein
MARIFKQPTWYGDGFVGVAFDAGHLTTSELSGGAEPVEIVRSHEALRAISPIGAVVPPPFRTDTELNDDDWIGVVARRQVGSGPALAFILAVPSTIDPRLALLFFYWLHPSLRSSSYEIHKERHLRLLRAVAYALSQAGYKGMAAKPQSAAERDQMLRLVDFPFQPLDEVLGRVRGA